MFVPVFYEATGVLGTQPTLLSPPSKPCRPHKNGKVSEAIKTALLLALYHNYAQLPQSTLNGTDARLAGHRAPVPLPVERQLEDLVIGGLYFALDRVVGALLLQVALLERE